MALFRSTPRILDGTLITTENSATNSSTYSTSVGNAIILPPGTYIVEMLAKVVASAAGTPATASAKYQPVFSGTSTMDGIYMAAGYRADAYLGNATLAGTETASRLWDFENNANFASFYAILDYRRFRARVTASGTIAMKFSNFTATASTFCQLLYGSYIRAVSI